MPAHRFFQVRPVLEAKRARDTSLRRTLLESLARVGLISVVAVAAAADQPEATTGTPFANGSEAVQEPVPTAPPPRFTWSPPQGFVFVENSCGSDDQILGWMAPARPETLRDAKLIMFSGAKEWRPRFQEASEHFIAKWTDLKGRKVVVVPGDHGRLKNDPVAVQVPKETPFEAKSFQEAMFLQGYSGGYMDVVNARQLTNSPVSDAREVGWKAGRAAAGRGVEKE